MKLLSTLLALLVLVPLSAAGADPGEARELIEQAKLRAGVELDSQAEALTRLAWPEGPGGADDPLVAALARAELVDAGANAFPAMYRALSWVDPVYSADIVAALIESRERIPAGIPHSYIPSMDLALWTGSVEAKGLAMVEIATHQFRPDMLAIQDAAIEHPELMHDAVRNLVRLGDDRARFFFGDLLEGRDDEHRTLAAEALAKIGGRCHDVLRDAVLSNRLEVRRSALTALLPVSGVGDLSVLYEYLARSGDDDPELAEAIRERAKWLESLLEEEEGPDAG